MPAGLDVSVAGSAVLGRDTELAEEQSAKDVEKWTLVVVIGLLLTVYRAPVLALIPLVTVAVASVVALRLLGLLAEVGHLHLFQGTKVYITVIGYGAGVELSARAAPTRGQLRGGQHHLAAGGADGRRLPVPIRVPQELGRPEGRRHLPPDVLPLRF